MRTRFFLLTAAVLLAVACSHKIAEPVSCNVTLDPSNTYFAGDPVRFLMKGHADNILFYSGESGSCYVYKDRHSVPMDWVKSAALSVEYSHEWGVKGGLDVYVSNSFNGLDGRNGAADRVTIQQMIDSGMQGWTRIGYDDNASSKGSATQTIDLNAYKDHFSLAIHWHPAAGATAQRTYKIKGELILDIEGFPAGESFHLTDLEPLVVTMNEQLAPYYKNGGTGSVNFDGEEEITCRGVAADELSYALDAWIITTPSALNKVHGDKGFAIKNLQNYMSGYEYIYSAPGNYTVTFVCIDHNAYGFSQSEQSIDLSIIEKW